MGNKSGQGLYFFSRWCHAQTGHKKRTENKRETLRAMKKTYHSIFQAVNMGTRSKREKERDICCFFPHRLFVVASVVVCPPVQNKPFKAHLASNKKVSPVLDALHTLTRDQSPLAGVIISFPFFSFLFGRKKKKEEFVLTRKKN